MTPLSPTALEEAADAAFGEMDNRGLFKDVGDDLFDEIKADVATAAITAYLAQAEKEGWVMVPKEITEAMRWATWIDQSKHVGANAQEARILAGRRMIDNPEQKAMDESAYRAMLAAAQNGGE